jgi:hypothetical protein
MNIWLIAVGALAFTTSALATSTDPLPNSDRNACFSLTLIKERRVLDPQRIVVWSHNSPYLITLDRPVQDLKYPGNAIAFVDGDRDGYICRTVRDGIVVQDTLLPKRSQVIGVTQLSADDIKQLEAKYNTTLERKKRGQHRSADAQS